MADLKLQRQPNGKYDFVRNGGDLERTTDHTPAILRLLIQGEWIGDDGEREGEAIPDIKFIDQNTDARVRRIVDRRLSKLVDSGDLTSFSVLRVITEGDRVHAEISVQRPGEEPKTVQVPILK